MGKMLGIGIIGCGGIANGKHMPEIAKSDGGRIAALCDISETALNAAGDKYGIPQEKRFRNYLDLIGCGDVDAADICTPNYLHCEMAHASIAAGKPFCVEKPVGISYDEVVRLREAADKAGIKSMVCFSYRFMQAARYAKHLVEQGILGTINAAYVQYLKSSAFMKGRRLDWRFDEKQARYGVSGDLGVHLIDLVHFLAGEITGVCAQTGIVVKERKKLDNEEIVPVTTDDYCNFVAKIKGGASATFAITRCAPGNTNTIRADIYGDKGGIRFNLNKKEEIEFCAEPEGRMQALAVPEEYKASQMQAFIDVVLGRQDKWSHMVPDLEDGCRCQKVLDMIMDSDASGRWEYRG